MVTTLTDFMRQLDPYYELNLKVELKSIMFGPLQVRLPFDMHTLSKIPVDS